MDPEARGAGALVSAADCVRDVYGVVGGGCGVGGEGGMCWDGGGKGEKQCDRGKGKCK